MADCPELDEIEVTEIVSAFLEEATRRGLILSNSSASYYQGCQPKARNPDWLKEWAKSYSE